MGAVSISSYKKRMKAILSFFFSEDEVNDIVFDYDERVNIAVADGGASEDVVKSFEPPWRECRKVIAESGISPVSAVVSQKKFKMLLLVCLFSVAALYLSMRCERMYISFFAPALIINLLFGGGIFLADKGVSKIRFSAVHFLLALYVCLQILIVGIGMPKLAAENKGEICVFIMLTVMSVLLLANIILIFAAPSVEGISSLSHHIMIVVLITMYMVSQLHIMQNSISEFSSHVFIMPLCIYGESIILHLFRLGRQRLWTCN